MPFFKSLPEDAGVAALWEVFNPDARKGLSIFSRSFMRNDSKLTPADKEMIAAYVSQLNTSDYCFAGHSRVAINLGVDEAVFPSLADDIDGSLVRDEMKPLLHLIKKLTLTPACVRQEDMDPVFAAGWDEQSVHEAICVCARFSMMNRLTMGHGLVVDEERRARDALKMNYGEPEK